MQVGCALGIYLCIQKGPRAAYFDIFFAYRNYRFSRPIAFYLRENTQN